MSNNKKRNILTRLCGIFTAAVCVILTASSPVLARAEVNAAERIQTITGYGEIDLLNPLKAMQPLSLKPGNTFVGTSYYTQLDDLSQDIYNVLYSEYKNGGHGDFVSVFSAFQKNDKLVFDSVEQIEEQLASHIYTAFFALSADYPEYSWISFNRYGYTYGYYPSGEAYNLAAAKFRLVNGYNYGTPSAMESAIAAAKKEIGNSPDRYTQVLNIHEYICNLTDYNYTAISKNQPAGYDDGWYQTGYSTFYPIAENNETRITTVCAGYSKAFKALCGSYGIPCVTVSGVTDTNGAHMWNYVQMEDGAWYAIDSTWDDQTESGDGVLDDFFLVGGNSIPTNFTKITFNQSHISSGNWNGMNYIFAYPKLSNDKYEPTKEITVTDKENNTGVTVTAPEGVLNGDAVLNVEKTSNDSEDEITFDITLTLNGKAYQPNGQVSVSIPAPADMNAEEIKVYYKKPDNSYADMNAVLLGSNLVFTTDHFSEYVVTTKALAPVGVLGDLNGDTKVTIADARLLLQAASGSRVLTAEQKAAADVNKDGNVNITDARWLLQVASGSRKL